MREPIIYRVETRSIRIREFHQIKGNGNIVSKCLFYI